MERSISFGAVKKGDVVAKREGVGVRVERIACTLGQVTLFGRFTADETLTTEIYGGFDEVVSLLGRSWPPGKTKRDMLLAVDIALTDMWLGRIPPDQARAKLRAALDDYELGLNVPPASEQPTRNESLIDRHMTP